MKTYNQKNFIRIRDFLVDTYSKFQMPYNWTIERWNFSISVARIMNGVSMEEWESKIAIWEQNQEIVGVVNSEGENEGEAFFQFADNNLPEKLIEEMFEFCESNLSIAKNGKQFVYLRIPPYFSNIEKIAQFRNFKKLPHTEAISLLQLDRELPVHLPYGFSFVYGADVTPEAKGQAHALAFGYDKEPLYCERSAIAFHQMTTTPDYQADLDIHILSPDKEIASFSTMWYDQRNRIGFLEPVGTIPKYRKLGLARANIMQLANQIRCKGGSKISVGSDQEFYMGLGFQSSPLYGVWMKEIE